MMEDDDAIAEVRARQIAQISNSSALNTQYYYINSRATS